MDGWGEREEREDDGPHDDAMMISVWIRMSIGLRISRGCAFPQWLCLSPLSVLVEDFPATVNRTITSGWFVCPSSARGAQTRADTGECTPLPACE
mmetsp:Transcript_22445/g.64155  ORF Transcript_22445/g.64155 Transcript_22445/m.64155 type:complete len:95 (+) Transcript_22445:1481-1765(+)